MYLFGRHSESSLLLFLERRPFEDWLCSGRVVQLELVVHRRLLRPRRVELSRVLVHQVSVLGPAGPAEVLDLHHLRQNRLVELVFQRGAGIVASKDVLLKLIKKTFILETFVFHNS